MVESKQVQLAENSAELKAEEEAGTNCPYMMRHGVCLIPSCCDLPHRIITIKPAENLSANAKEFNPFTGQMTKLASKEFNPEVHYAEVSTPNEL